MHKRIAAIVLAVVALVPMGASAIDNNGDGIDDEFVPTLEDDYAAIAGKIGQPGFDDFCQYELPLFALDLYLSPLFLEHEQEEAAEMLTAWLVELFEEEYQANLHWEAEEYLSAYFMDCMGHPQFHD